MDSTLTMRTILLSLFCLSLLSFHQTQNKKDIKTIPVSGTVTGTSIYCGGARPTGEMLAQLATPRPIGNKKIYIKKGNVNLFSSKVVLELTTDTSGKFHAKLSPGKYLIVDEEKKDTVYYNKLLKEHSQQTKSYQPIDTACLKEWFMKPGVTFEVKNSEIKNISVNFQKNCDFLPCAQFRGPYPQ